MSRRFFLISVALIVLVLTVACGTAPTPTPAPTQPPIIQTVIITATPAPVTATPIPPAPTAVIPTVAVITPTVVVVSTTAPTKAAVVATPRPAATRTPTKPAVVPTATPFPLKFGAPILNTPIWTDSQKDQVVAMGGAIVLDWKSLGGLEGDECYRIDIRTEPINPGPGVAAKGDYWVVKCGDQTPVNTSVKFTIESPNRVGALSNYGSIQPDGEVWAYWTLTVVKNLGSCEASYPFHCKTAPISGQGKGYFKFIKAN